MCLVWCLKAHRSTICFISWGAGIVCLLLCNFYSAEVTVCFSFSPQDDWPDLQACILTVSVSVCVWMSTMTWRGLDWWIPCWHHRSPDIRCLSPLSWRFGVPVFSGAPHSFLSFHHGKPGAQRDWNGGLRHRRLLQVQLVLGGLQCGLCPGPDHQLRCPLCFLLPDEDAQRDHHVHD